MNFFILLATALSPLGGSFADRFVSIYHALIFADIFIHISESIPLDSVCGMTSVDKVCTDCRVVIKV